MVAIDCGDLTVTYKELFQDAKTFSEGLRGLGVSKGQIVSIYMPNIYQAVVAFLACNRIGAVATFINYGASDDEIIEYVKLYESPILISYDKTENEYKKVLDNSQVKYIIALSRDDVNSRMTERSIGKEDSCIIGFNHIKNYSGDMTTKSGKVYGDDEALILYTSGTTGKPKSVVLTNTNILAAGMYCKNDSKANSLVGKRTLICVPFTYPYGFCTSLISTLLTGKTAILAPDISMDTVTYYMGKQPNIIFGSPALLELIIRNVPEDMDLSSVGFFLSGGDFLSVSNYNRGKEFFKNHNAKDMTIGNGSGNAETVSCGTNPIGVSEKPDTAGKVLVGTEIMIVDPETMEQKKIGEEGMLCHSGKHVFKEYYRDPELTNEVKFEYDGKVFFKTGTLGSIDEDGYFKLTGRLSRFYILSTLNKVYLDHVQSIMDSFDCVEECAVVKVEDAKMLFVNKAFIVLKKGLEKGDEILHHLHELCKKPTALSDGEVKQLKWYEIPTYVEFVDALPRRSGTDKIDYMKLENEAATNHDGIKLKDY